MLVRASLFGRNALISGAVIGAAFMMTAPVLSSSLPILPQATIDTTLPQITRTINVPPGGLQAAVNAAIPGDMLILTAGVTYQGPITLPMKSGSGWIVLKSSGTLPAAGVRVSPANAPQMAKIAGGVGSVPAIDTAPGAHNYRFIGIELLPGPGTPANTGLIRLGTGVETDPHDFPDKIIFDRCYIHGDATNGGRRGISAQGTSIAAIDSYISNWHVGGSDSQAFASWNGPGPFLLRNNYLEGSGENVMFGGADSQIANLVPSDITIINNDFAKPQSWMGNPDALVKNIFELKNARRVLVDHNTFSYNWVDGQTGVAINLKSNNQDGNNPWAVTEHVTFTNNIVRHAGGGMALSTQENSQPLAHILIRCNIFEDIKGATWGGTGNFILTGAPMNDLTIDSNFVDNDGRIVSADLGPSSNLVFTNNIVPFNTEGVRGSGTGTGIPTLNYYFPGYVFSGNQIVGGAAFAGSYPGGNTYPATVPANSTICNTPQPPSNLRIVTTQP